MRGWREHAGVGLWCYPCSNASFDAGEAWVQSQQWAQDETEKQDSKKLRKTDTEQTERNADLHQVISSSSAGFSFSS